MSVKQPVVVIGDDGVRGVIDSDRTRTPYRDPGATVIRLEDGRRLSVPGDVLRLQPDGSYRLPLSAEEVRRLADEFPPVIPVIEERLIVSKQPVETGTVEIRKVVGERTETVGQPVLRQEVRVERVPVNKVVEQSPGVRQEGDTLVVPLLEEVLVVEKRLMLREDLRITRESRREHQPQEVHLRREDVEVRRRPAADRPEPGR
jgi:uncharacterized protein (TIGR02271 family)